MKILISTLFFYKPELSQKFLAEILPTLRSHADLNPSDEIHFVVSDNTPASESNLEELSLKFRSFQSERLKLTFRRNQFNEGFGNSHNKTFSSDDSDLFVVLNNDIFIDAASGTWLNTLVAPLREADTRIALVGTTDSPSLLTVEAEGRYRNDDRAPDYVEGSIMAVRSIVARKLGLFSPELEIAYFEDSDLSLRLRQAGWGILHIDIKHEHRRGSSSTLVDPHALASVRMKNQALFLKRWKIYLERRTFTNRIFLDFCTGGWGDLVAALPVLVSFLKDHPTATIELQTNHVSLKDLLSFPRVQIITENFIQPEEAHSSGRYDRVFSLSEVDFSSPLYLGMQIANTAGVHFDMSVLQSDSHLMAIKCGGHSFALDVQDKKVAIIHAQASRKDWEGRFPRAATFLPLVEELKKQGYFTILIGGDETQTLGSICHLDLSGRTPLLELFPLMAKASLFLGMDSGPLHVAQLLEIPSFAIFGATLPSSRLYNLSNSHAHIRSDLPCISCYQRKLLSPRNYCLRRDEACINDLSTGVLINDLRSFLKSGNQLQYPHLAIDRAVWADKLLLAGKAKLTHAPTLEETRIRHLASALLRRILAAIKHKLH